MVKKNKNSKKLNRYDFSGIPINELITKPLLDISRAQSKMAEEQVRLLLKNCFRFNGEYYEPVVIKMCVTRAEIAPVSDATRTCLEQITTYFDLPLIAIFSFSPLGIDTVNIDFNIEVMAQFKLENNEPDEDENENSSDGNSSGLFNKNQSGFEIIGKIAPKTNTTTELDEEGLSISSNYSLNVVARSLPLTKGLLNIIDIYTKAIEPVTMPEFSKTKIK